MWLRAVAIVCLLALPIVDAMGPTRLPTYSRRERNISKEIYPRLLDATLDELSSGLQNGHFTSVDLVKAYLGRIKETNATLHALTEVNPDALLIANDLDTKRAKGTVYGPLHGIPVILKDNIATCDKMQNTAGSYALLGSKVPKDSTVAAKLRKAGAIILGKANLSQWANARSFNTSSGWSAYGGQAIGAYYAEQDPSGSSSGSGIASSIGLAWASLGTETAGSILMPSQAGNLVGIKPTVGLTSRYLVIPISEHQDTVGPMARTVKDAAYLLQSIVGADSNDNYTSAIPFAEEKIPDYVAACNVAALKGKRIGVPRNLLNFTWVKAAEAPITSAFELSLNVIRAAGATVVDNITLPGRVPLEEYGYMQNLLAADLVTNVRQYLSKLVFNPNNMTSLSSLRDFTRSFPLERYPERDTGIFDRALAVGYDNDSPEFWGNYTAAQYLAGHLGLTGALANYSLDALVIPTYFASYLPAVLGSPGVTVPMGRLPDGTPIQRNSFGNLNLIAPNSPFGISFLGPRFSEELLIGIAYAYEQRTMVRTSIRPFVEPKTELVNVVVQKAENQEVTRPVTSYYCPQILKQLASFTFYRSPRAL